MDNNEKTTEVQPEPIVEEPSKVEHNCHNYNKEITELRDTIKILSATVQELKAKPQPKPEPEVAPDPYADVW